MAPYLAFFAAGDFETRSGSCDGVPYYVAVSKQLPAIATRRGATVLAAQTRDRHRLARGRARGLPVLDHRRAGHRPPGGFALENQTRPTYPARLGQPAAGGARARPPVVRRLGVGGPLARHLAQRGLRDVHGDTTTEARRPSAQTWLATATTRFAPGAASGSSPSTTPGRRRSSTAPVYFRGAMALQALRNRIGDDAFWTLLRTWVSTRALGNGSIADFRALAETISGQDLDGFFDAWLHPRSRLPTTAANGLWPSPRSRTDRQVTQPSSFSNSVMSMATTRRPRSSNSSRVRGAEVDISTVVLVEQHDVGARLLGHGRNSGHGRVVDERLVADDGAVGQRGDGGLQVQHLGDRYADHVAPSGARWAASWSSPAWLVRPPSPTQTVPPCLSTSPPSSVPGSSMWAIR